MIYSVGQLPDRLVYACLGVVHHARILRAGCSMYRGDEHVLCPYRLHALLPNRCILPECLRLTFRSFARVPREGNPPPPFLPPLTGVPGDEVGLLSELGVAAVRSADVFVGCVALLYVAVLDTGYDPVLSVLCGANSLADRSRHSHLQLWDSSRF